MDVVDALDPVVLLQRHRVEAAELADARRRRRAAPASALDGGAGRGCARRGRARPGRCGRGPAPPSGRSSRRPTPWPRAPATAARSASTSSRLKPSMVAIRSAPMPCGTKPVVVVGLRVHAPRRRRRSPSAPATSTRRRRRGPGPPSRSGPSARRCSPPPGPEAQNRLSCTPATCRAARRRCAAVLAMSAPCSPTGDTTPSTMSSTSGRVEPGMAPADLVDQPDDERDRLDPVQRAVRLSPPARGADRVVDVRLGRHGHSCRSPRMRICVNFLRARVRRRRQDAATHIRRRQVR